MSDRLSCLKWGGLVEKLTWFRVDIRKDIIILVFLVLSPLASR